MRGCSKWSSTELDDELELGMKLGLWIWRKGEKDTDLLLAYLLPSAKQRGGFQFLIQSPYLILAGSICKGCMFLRI